MDDVGIIRFSKLRGEDLDRYLLETEDLFFRTAIKKEFQTSLQKQKYYRCWLGIYLEAHPELTLLAVSGQRCVGYITGVPDSAAEGRLFKINPTYDVFSDLYGKYPGHLHINCCPDFQRKGIGSILMESFIEMLVQNSAHGVHIITTPDAGNVSFYRKMGFFFQEVRTFRDNKLLFMARNL